MHYSLGIDAGGTYTDAVIIRNSDREVIDTNKALTTYPDLLKGIENAIDGLDEQYLRDVRLVSVSTTLATNTILEKTGYPVALILIGKHTLAGSTPIQELLVVKGGHNLNGTEDERLDTEAIKEYVLKVRDRVSAFAISSYFSIRNPDHELRAKELISVMTGLPVVCGHELSQDLGAYERGVTAYLNAQLLPVARHFIDAIMSDIRKRGINAKLMMLKCDGSVIGIEEALEKPIESVFSGPAASLMGASFLSRSDTCAVIDVGGTSTDVSLTHGGFPQLVDTGAVVGGWHTKVKAIRMETSAMGGDSHVWIRNRGVNIGPRRVVPLCLAAVKYPGFKELLKSGRTPSRFQLAENIQPTKFFVRTGKEGIGLGNHEKEILATIGEEPVSINDIFWKLGRLISPDNIDSLIQKRLIQAIGFTPTDALHVLGEYTEWDIEASMTGADLLGSLAGMESHEFAGHIKREFTKNMAANIVSFFLEGVPKQEIRKIFDIQSPAKFKVEVPVVLIGGPVAAFAEDLRDILDAEIILPPNYDVGNATGALAAKGIRRAEILIRPASMAAPEWEFLVFSEKGRNSFYDYQEALDYAVNLGEMMVIEYMKDAGLDSSHIRIDIKKDEIIPNGWKTPMETKLVVMGIGTLNAN